MGDVTRKKGGGEESLGAGRLPELAQRKTLTYGGVSVPVMEGVGPGGDIVVLGLLPPEIMPSQMSAIYLWGGVRILSTFGTSTHGDCDTLAGRYFLSQDRPDCPTEVDLSENSVRLAVECRGAETHFILDVRAKEEVLRAGRTLLADLGVGEDKISVSYKRFKPTI